MHILYKTGSGERKEFTTESKLVILGRLKSKQRDYLSLSDDKVSAHHARLTLENGEYWVEDLGSTNGTWVNNKRIRVKTHLTPKSVIRVGGTSMKVEVIPGQLTPPPTVEKTIPPQETPAETVKTDEPLPDLVLDETSSKKTRHRLSVFFELSSELGEIDNIESLASIIITHLHKAFPRKGRFVRCGFLLGEDLVLKAYHPHDKPPSCSTTLARYVLEKKEACLWNVDSKTEVDKSASLFQHKTQSAMYAPVMWKDETLGVLYADASSPKAAFSKDDLQLMQAIGTLGAMFMNNFSLQQNLQREAVVKERLLAQFPPKIAERLSHQPDRISFASEKVDKVSVLFSDVRGFTKLSAKLEPEQVVKMLNDMFHDLTPIVLKYNGTVDKYMGDAILAVFGCPEPDALQWEHAVQAALEMQEAIKHLQSSRWKNQARFQVGIGIHTGSVIHGFIGARERMEYTVIGNTINVASRYCDGAAAGEVLISPAVYERLHHKVEVDHPARLIETKHEGKLKAYVVRSWRDKEDA
jgi:adenylate cyclase